MRRRAQARLAHAARRLLLGEHTAAARRKRRAVGALERPGDERVSSALGRQSHSRVCAFARRIADSIAVVLANARERGD